jgi:hypothetical protein
MIELELLITEAFKFSLLNKSSSLAATLGAAQFITITDVKFVTLLCSSYMIQLLMTEALKFTLLNKSSSFAAALGEAQFTMNIAINFSTLSFVQLKSDLDIHETSF